MNRHSNSNDFLRNLPDPPWWLIIICFSFATPLAILMLLAKIIRQSQPRPERWQGQTGSASQQTAYRTYTDAEGQTRVVPADRKQAAQEAKIKRQQAAGGAYAPTRFFPYVPIRGGKAFTIAGAATFLVSGMAFLDEVLNWGVDYPSDFLAPFIFAGCGLGLALWGIFKTRQAKKFKNYLARMSNDPIIQLRPLAESMGAGLEEVYDTVQDMIDLGVFGQRAYLDVSNECLVVDATVAKPKPKEKPKEPAPDLTTEDKILAEIRRADELIPDEEISRKIVRIEEITRHILNYLKKHPERSSELHTFLDYYLPTTLKMLHTYAELDAQQVDSDNIAVTKRRIEGVLDKVVEGFEAQLDKLFEGDMLDISSDIDVMEKMLQRDGLAGELKIPKAPEPVPSSGGYQPKLTLDPEGAAAAEQPERKVYDDLGAW